MPCEWAECDVVIATKAWFDEQRRNFRTFRMYLFAGGFDFPMNCHRFGEFEMLKMSTIR
jgi:hypothetical protein